MHLLNCSVFIKLVLNHLHCLVISEQRHILVLSVGAKAIELPPELAFLSCEAIGCVVEGIQAVSRLSSRTVSSKVAGSGVLVLAKL